MLIDLRELLSGSKDVMELTVPIGMDTFHTSLATYEFKKKDPVQLVLTKTDKNHLSLACSCSVILLIPCDRCLTPVSTPVSFSIRQEISMEQNTDGVEDQEEQDFIDGYNLDVDRLIFDELLMRIPGKTLCREDCKGLCPVCGANLNVTECGCDRTSLDPRMSVFKDILNNIKEV